MPQIMLDVPDKVIEELNKLLKDDLSTEVIIGEALALLLWAAKVEAEGNIIAAATQEYRVYQRAVISDANAEKTAEEKRASFRLIVSQGGS